MTQEVLDQLHAGLPSAMVDSPGHSSPKTAGFGAKSDVPVPSSSTNKSSDGFPAQAATHASPAALPRPQAASSGASTAGTEEAESALMDFCVQGDGVHALAQLLASLLSKSTHLPGKSRRSAGTELPLPLPGPHAVVSGILLMAWPWDKRQAEERCNIAELCPAPASLPPAADTVATRASKQRDAPAAAAAGGLAEDLPAGALPGSTSTKSAAASDPHVVHAESSHVEKLEYDVASSVVAALPVGVLTGQGNSDPACLLSRGTLVDRFYGLVAYALSALSEAMAVLNDQAMFQMLMGSAAGVVSNFAGLDKRMVIMARSSSSSRPARAAAGWKRGRQTSIDTSECPALTLGHSVHDPADQPRLPRAMQPSTAAMHAPPVMYTGGMPGAKQVGRGPIVAQPSPMWHASMQAPPLPAVAPQHAQEPRRTMLSYTAPYTGVPGAMHPMVPYQYMQAWAVQPVPGMGQAGTPSAAPLEPGRPSLPRAPGAVWGAAVHADTPPVTYCPGVFVHPSSASMAADFVVPYNPWWPHQAAAYGGHQPGAVPMVPVPYSLPPPAAQPSTARRQHGGMPTM